MGIPALPPDRGQGYVWSRLRVFFHFSVFFSLFGPLRRQARVQACPGQGQAQAQPYMRSRLSVFFSLSRIFFTFGPFPRGSPCLPPAAQPGQGPTPYMRSRLSVFFHFPVFFHFWSEVKKYKIVWNIFLTSMRHVVLYSHISREGGYAF